MNLPSNTFQELISQLRNLIQGTGFANKSSDEEPFRSELFNSEQMNQYSIALAKSHKISKKKMPDQLLPRLADNEKVLLEVRQLLTKAVKEDYEMSPASEWLLDNFYLIEEQIRLSKKHLPKGYSQGLPQLNEGHSAGLPRVYDIVLELISHSDGRVDGESISDFLTSYSTVTHLKLGELWAIPIMLRLALIENLRRVSSSIAIDRVHKSLADYWAKELLETAERNPKNLILVLADLARSSPPLERAFIAEFTRQLRGKGPTLAQALTWIEQRLAENGQSSNELVQAENQKQAADQVSVSNSIGSLRCLASIDWRNFVETHSVVEQILREDAVYPLMDFSTRDHYRHALERIAKKSEMSEEEVAHLAIQLAKSNSEKELPDDRMNHVGYYLIGKGLKQTEQSAQIHIPQLWKLQKTLGRFPLLIYLGAIFVITLVISVLIVLQVNGDTTNILLLTLIGVLSVLCASQLASGVVNFLSTLIVRPSLLPRMDYSRGIPEESRTLVVIPCMLKNVEDIDSLLESLEVHFLANKGDNLHFGLLTDFADADKKELPEDKKLIGLANQRIHELRQKYSAQRTDIFFLFHRNRKWNPAQGKWMGYERKRGKLDELNGLLRRNAVDNFSLIVGEQSVLPKVKYVITLDSDTQLPRDAAWKMTGAIAHPLNIAVYNEAKHRVVEGYGILQPRVSISLPDSTSSAFTRMSGNEPGIDPYTRAVSDVYQDIFEEGSFIGKGIYDVDIFEKTLHHKFPENRILSHDLLEGCYARSGLLSDVQLYEKYPSDFLTDMQRRHRWVRGDWQIAAWILPFVPDADFRWHKNPLSGLSRWKIFDNLRRSLVAVALTLFIIIGWTVLPSAGFWTFLITAIIIVPALLVSLWSLFIRPKDVILKHHIILSTRAIGKTALATLFDAIILPHEAFINLDALVRTAWRMLISHKYLLQWRTLGKGEYSKHKDLITYYLSMWAEPAIALSVFTWLIIISPYILVTATPILLLWLFAPVITWHLSKPAAKEKLQLSTRQNIFLHKVARKTWSFFERMVTADDNWLPPDNYQEAPKAVIAHRTSPTNIGLYLLSNLSAHDFGYITTSDFIVSIQRTIDTMGKMERYRGHFYNWYDTQSLKPLNPRYISTVDSGNLAGHLLTLRQGILELPKQKIVDARIFEGLQNTFRILADIADKSDLVLLQPFKTELQAAHEYKPANLSAFRTCLESLQKAYNDIHLLNTNKKPEIEWWMEALSRQIQCALQELKMLAPWIFLSDIPSQFQNVKSIKEIPTLLELSKLGESFLNEISGVTTFNKDDKEWLNSFQSTAKESVNKVNDRLEVIEKLAKECNEFSQMELNFLFDKTKDLMTIGYNVDDHRSDPSYYDLLASEARLAIFVGIAQGRLPQESWFAFSRLLTNVDGHPILLSWSGSMFEYLMPLLVMPSYPNTLINKSDKEAVDRQIDYGTQRNVPWGVSESCYNARDNNQNYQYRAFGVPGLGLKRGLGEDLVIAPYATVLALMVQPDKACQNLQLMSSRGFEGKYGFYESVDYTPSRLPPGQSYAIVNSYMAHHQGMSFLSLAYVLLNQLMQKRFEAEPQFQATLLLLQERIPKATTFYMHTTEIAEIQSSSKEPEVRVIHTPNTPIPAVQLLSNGRYHVMITNAGGGYSRWKDLAVTRWREDSTCDNWGVFCYVRDKQDGAFWSVAHQPTLKPGRNFEVTFSQGRADLHIVHNGIVSHTEIVVSPEDDIEMRRLHITNLSGKRKTLDITSYAEVVIAHPDDDAAHPAFSNLFVQTEILPLQHAILCSRRPRSKEEKPPWMFHMVKVHGKEVKNISYETDRLKFLGRGNTIVSPKAMNTSEVNLSGSQGPVLDPIVSIRVPFTLEPDETISLDIVLGMAETREICQNLVDKYQDKFHKDRVFELSWTHNQVVTRQINASESEAQLYNRLAGSVIFMNPAQRAEAAVLIRNQRGQAGLWPYSISGDLPIVLLKVEEETEIELVRQMIQAHTYWRLKGLIVDLVIWNEKHGGYRQLLQNQISELLATQVTDQNGGIFVRTGEQISEEDRILFQTVARVIISGEGGTLADHINRKGVTKQVIPNIAPTQPYSSSLEEVLLPGNLIFFNELGGFSEDGKEYVIHVKADKMTPAPWVNVIANPNFGTIITESGQSYTWRENAHEFRLTPWNNDSVCDSAGETFYLRDEETGHFWSPSPLQTKSQSGYVVRHGFGYSIIEHNEDGIHSEMWVYVDIESAIKFTVLKLKNKSGRARRISVTGYVELVLGDLRSKTEMYLVTEFNVESESVFAKNPYNTEFPDRVVFFGTDETVKTFTGDRTEFIGRNGTLQNPDALQRTKLSGKVGVGLDPCAAIQVTVDLFDGQEREVTFKLGAGQNRDEAQNIVREFKGQNKAQEALDKVTKYWKDTLSTLQVETPDVATNIMANGWLLYQTISCRLWGRSGFYQSGGAFGFRDQLQDIMALVYAAPSLARKQILLSASRQFAQGDAQHWWHTPSGRGVRTRCSDDFLWLPLATCRYVTATGDSAILDEKVSFLQGRTLNPGEDSYYELSAPSTQQQSLYMHCVKAIKHGLSFGVHGLPLMGTGDWNDGMDRVGKDGKGESIWLGFFLYDILMQFRVIANAYNDPDFAKQCKDESEKLKKNIDKNAWDGNWYLRAFFDDGKPLGSSTNAECKIDSIAQSWSVLSGCGEKERGFKAIENAYTHLVQKDTALIQLLTPAFDKSDLDPGYIKGYLPGVRENGGQYTHAAVWLIMALAKAGDNKRTWELLQLINPINHGKTANQIQTYTVEPYVTAGDVYAVAPHTGKGGWTWYTGSAGWMYRLITESFLGIIKEGNKLAFKPCVPAEWTSYKVHYRFAKTIYSISVSQVQGEGKISVMLDNVKQEDESISLIDDGAEHLVEITIFSNQSNFKTE